MQLCTICHTGAMLSYEGRTDGQFVYALRQDGELTKALWREYPGPPGDIYRNLIQLEVDGKWGYANFATGEIVITPQWDFAEPFMENGQAIVVFGCKVHWPDNRDDWLIGLHVESGRFGLIDITGEIIRPCTEAYPGWGNGSSC